MSGTVHLNSIIVISSLVATLVCFWHRQDIPRDLVPDPAVMQEPRQTATGKNRLDVRYSGIDYRVVPEFDYDLSGIVVSYRHHDGQSRMHRRAGDQLNMLDVCVIWGANATHPDINKLDFWNGIFTCNVSTRDRAAWQAFDMNRLSNNHLISDDPAIREAVAGIAVGDQVRIRGYLASYSGPGGTRGTSTTRTDSGDGACETLYVAEFAVLEPANNHWLKGMYASLVVFIGGIVGHFRRPYRPHRRSTGPVA